MNSQEIKFHWEGLGEILGTLFKSGVERITIIAPYIKKSTLEHLLLNVNGSVAVDIITRWEVDEIAAGVSDTSIMDLATQRDNFRVFLSEHLHAKLYLIDDRVASLGSPNMTNAALGWSQAPNVELMTVIEPIPLSLLLFSHRLLRDAVEATLVLQKQFQEAADLRKKFLPLPSPIEISLPDAKRPLVLFPSLRSPDRLFLTYSQMRNISSREEREAALNDLSTLDLPDGLDEFTFMTDVGSKLLQIPEIAAFDVFVLTPRRFGALTDWAKETFPTFNGDHHASQRYVQCLLRWLIYFLPARYVLTEPKYSEVFARRLVC